MAPRIILPKGTQPTPPVTTPTPTIPKRGSGSTAAPVVDTGAKPFVGPQLPTAATGIPKRGSGATATTVPQTTVEPTPTAPAVSPDLGIARRELNIAQAQARRAGVPAETVQAIATGQKKPNKGIQILGKVIGFDIVPDEIPLSRYLPGRGDTNISFGKKEFKPIESLVFGPATKLDVGRRAVLSTLIETGDVVGGLRGNKSQKVYTEGTSGKTGFNFSDWIKQTNDKTIGYGKIVASPTGNKWVDRGIGFVGDVLLDPVTWVAGPGGIAKQEAIAATEAGGKAATLAAERAAAEAAASAAAKTAADVLADTAATTAQKAAAEAAAQTAAQKVIDVVAREAVTIPKVAETAEALAGASVNAERRVLGARTREELAQIAREIRDVAVKTGNTSVVNTLTDEVIGEIATKGYTAIRGPVAEVLGVRGGLRITNPAVALTVSDAVDGKLVNRIPFTNITVPDKFRLLPQITEPFTNAIGSGLTTIRVGTTARNFPAALSFINKGFVNTELGQKILNATTPIGEGGLYGTEQLKEMRVALRSGTIKDAVTGVARKLTGAESNDFVRLLAQDRAYRFLAAQTNADAIRLLSPSLGNKKFFKYSNTLVDLLDKKVVQIADDGTKLLVPAVDFADATMTPARASAILGRKVSPEEFNIARQVRGALDEFWANNNFLNQRQRVAAGFGLDEIQDLPKNTSFFPHTLSPEAFAATKAGKMPKDALQAVGLDRTFALAGTNPRELTVGATWFGRRLTPEDVAGGVKRFNEIAREGGLKFNFFETNAENALTRYGQATARDNAFTQWLYNMAQATEGTGPFGKGTGPYTAKAFGDIVQEKATQEIVGRKPSTLSGFENAVNDVITPQRIEILNNIPAYKKQTEALIKDIEDLKNLVGAKAGAKKPLYYDQVNQTISDLEQRVRDLERIAPVPSGYPAAISSEAEALYNSLRNEASGLVLNTGTVRPTDWVRTLPIFNSSIASFLQLNAAKYPGLVASPEVRELLTNMQRLEDPLINQLMPKALNDTTQMFKAWVTATPGFHSRNALSNVFFMFSAGADPQNMSEAAKYYSAYNSFLKRSGKTAAAIPKSAAKIAAEDRALGSLSGLSSAVPPSVFEREFEYVTRSELAKLGPSGTTILDFYLSPEYMNLKGFPKGFNPYTTTDVALQKKWADEVSTTYRAILANATSGYGLLGDVFEGGGRRGISGRTNTRTLQGAETQAEKAAGVGANISRALAKPLAWSKEAGGKIENYTRFALTYDGLMKGLTPEEAAARTAKYLIDYQDLSQADKAIKPFIPFFTWTSRSFPLIVESAWLNPKAYAVYNSLQRNLTDTSGGQDYKPSYLEQSFKLPFGGNLYANPDLGFQKQEEAFGKLTDPMSILSSISPLYRAPIEAALNQRFQTGEQIFNPYYQDKGQAQVNYILQQLFPQTQAASRIGNVATAFSQDPLTALLAGAGGVAGGLAGGPAGAVLGSAAGTGAGLAGQGLAGGQVIPPVQGLADVLQKLPGVGKPSYIEQEQGGFTPEESRQKLFGYFGLPATQLQDYQQVQAIKALIKYLEQEAAKAKNK